MDVKRKHLPFSTRLGPFQITHERLVVMEAAISFRPVIGAAGRAPEQKKLMFTQPIPEWLIIEIYIRQRLCERFENKTDVVDTHLTSRVGCTSESSTCPAQAILRRGPCSSPHRSLGSGARRPRREADAPLRRSPSSQRGDSSSRARRLYKPGLFRREQSRRFPRKARLPLSYTSHSLRAETKPRR